MSEVQAIENEDNPEVVEGAVEAVDTEELEIVVEEEEKPSSRRLTGFEKRLRKKNAQIDQSNAEAESLREENKLLRLAQEQKLESEPEESKFETDEEYRTALRNYDRQQMKVIAVEEVQASLTKDKQQITKESLTLKEQQSISAHYVRADNLKVKNYDDLESKAIEILGEDFAKTLIANTDNAHLILPYLGANPGKAVDIANMRQSDPVRAFAQAVAVGSNPNLTRPVTSTPPDPEVEVDPGSSLTSERGPKGAKFW
ncbi:MAG: hypothetical protein O7D95_06235 [Betaproteobacteria bacterium]|nr:hypothetical protein [Betaproteobacteria bacterium]